MKIFGEICVMWIIYLCKYLNVNYLERDEI